MIVGADNYSSAQSAVAGQGFQILLWAESSLAALTDGGNEDGNPFSFCSFMGSPAF